MPLINRLNLRQNWPLFVGEVSFLFLFVLFSTSGSQSISPYYHYQIGDKVEYSVLLSQYKSHTTDYPAILVVTSVIAALVSLLGLLRMPRRKALLALVFVILAFWWAGKIFDDSLPRGSTVLKHIESITFNQNSYKLTLLSNLPPDLDWTERSLLVYECATNNEECSLLQSVRDEKHQLSGKPDEASLIADPATNALYLQFSDQKTLIVQ